MNRNEKFKSFRKQVTLYLIAMIWTNAMIITDAHGAIADSDLSRISQLIQEGRTDRARAEIMILLDENPNDPRSPQLRRILGSLTVPESNESEPERTPKARHSSPTIEETLKWLNSRLVSFDYANTCVLSGQQTYYKNGITEFNVVDGLLVITQNYRTQFYADRLITQDQRTVSNVPLRRANLVDIVVSDKEQGVLRCNVREVTLLRIRTDHDQISRDWAGVGHDSHSHTLVGERNSRPGGLENPQEFLARRLANGLGTKSQVSHIELYIAEGAKNDRMRLKEAIDHLIKLHGGGQPEPF